MFLSWPHILQVGNHCLTELECVKWPTYWLHVITFVTGTIQDIQTPVQDVLLFFLFHDISEKETIIFFWTTTHKITQPHYTIKTIITYFVCRNYVVWSISFVSIFLSFSPSIFKYIPIKQTILILYYIIFITFYQLRGTRISLNEVVPVFSSSSFTWLLFNDFPVD